MKIKLAKQRGFSLVETIIYTASFALIMILIGTTLFSVYRWYERTVIAPRVDQAGVIVIDRLVRDIRSTESVNTGQSSFNTDSGSLSVNTKEVGDTITKVYTISSGKILLSEDGATPLPISPMGMYVSKLRFTKIDTSVSESIRAEVDIQYYVRNYGTTTKSFAGVAIMRNSYE
jgi:type II secretory pathway pseudopilin PulG